MVSSHVHHPRIISRIPPSRHQSTRVISFLVYWQTEAYVLYAVRSTLVVQTRLRYRRGIQHPYDVICELGGIRHRYGGDRVHGEGDRGLMGRCLARSLLIRSRGG